MNEVGIFLYCVGARERRSKRTRFGRCFIIVECRLVFERYQTCDLKDPTAVCTITGKLFTDKVSLAGSVRLHPPRTLEGRA